MSRHHTFACLLLAVLLCAAAPARAVVERDCVVAIQMKGGWSKEQLTTVHFMTGLELSRIVAVLPVQFHQVYAVISNGNGLPTVTRLDTVLPGVRREFTAADFVRMFTVSANRVATQIDGTGQSLKWRVRNHTPDRAADNDVVAMNSTPR